MARVWAPGLDSLPVFFIISKNNLREVSGHSENSYYCTKITPTILLKIAPVRVSSIQIMKAKTRAKEFGKVDTLETYQESITEGLYIILDALLMMRE